MSSTNRSYLSVLFAVISLVLASQITAFSQDLNKSNSSKSVSRTSARWTIGSFAARSRRKTNISNWPRSESRPSSTFRTIPTEYEKRNVEALGMKYVNIPMSDKDYPESAKIDQFLKLVDDPSTGKFYVHCAGGRHRTGVMGAVYRFNHYNWNYDQVYAEMKKYDFYTRWGHGDMKKFVQDYAVSFQNDEPRPSA